MMRAASTMRHLASARDAVVEPDVQADARPRIRRISVGTARIPLYKKPRISGLLCKRLKGFEPSTFCMAIRRSVREAPRAWGAKSRVQSGISVPRTAHSTPRGP
jgi:hypothetical protein